MIRGYSEGKIGYYNGRRGYFDGEREDLNDEW